ncbi:MAG: hypothetical protein RKH07_15045 [Gammaproteobacteria bacterium]
MPAVALALCWAGRESMEARQLGVVWHLTVEITDNILSLGFLPLPARDCARG